MDPQLWEYSPLHVFLVLDVTHFKVGKFLNPPQICLFTAGGFCTLSLITTCTITSAEVFGGVGALPHSNRSKQTFMTRFAGPFLNLAPQSVQVTLTSNDKKS